MGTLGDSPRTWFMPPAADRLQIEPDSNIITYTGPGGDDAAATVRTVESIPANEPLYYFEVEIISQGDTGCIAVGVSEASVHLHRLPGWEARSFGYHALDGSICHGETQGRPYGLPAKAGDCVGVCLDFVHRTLSFYKNGLCGGVAFFNLPPAPLHPCVGLRSREAKVAVNFGAQPFRHGVSLDNLRADLAADVSDTILNASIPPNPRSSRSPVALAILDHLIHTCCWRTAQVVARDLLGGQDGAAAPLLSDSDVKLMCMRQKVRQLVESGQALQAEVMLEEVWPGLLASRPDVKFSLELQGFVEMLRQGERSPAAQSAALNFARGSLPKLEVDAAQRERLRDALALLAYEDPMQSPSASLFHQDKRAACAAEVNGAIMRHEGRQASSAVESLYAQLEVVSRELTALGAPALQLLPLERVLQHGLQRRSRLDAGDVHDCCAMQE